MSKMRKMLLRLFRLSETDIGQLSAFLHIERHCFIEKYTRFVRVFHEQRLSLIEKAPYDCVFWNKDCTVYPARPIQCKTYPFWKRYLVSKREWNKIAEFCPGINRGKVYSRKEIDALINTVPYYNISKFSSDFFI
jgi:Fe-S-cluster containining protein